MSACAPESETDTSWPCATSDASVRSKSHCSGDPAAAAANGSSSTRRSKCTCRLTIALEPRPAIASASTAPAGTTRRTDSCGTATMTASASCAPSSSSTLRCSMPRTGVLRTTWTPPRVRAPARRVAVQPLQRDGRHADVAGVRGVEEPCAEDHRRERQRPFRRGQVQGRERDQVPELRDRLVGLAVRPKPLGERLRVERLVRGIELAQRGRRAQSVDALARAEQRVAKERRDEVERSGEWRAAQKRGRLAFAQHGDAQPRLDRDEVLGAEPGEEAAIRGAAAQEDVLAVVDPVVLAADRERRAAEARARFVQRDGRAGVGELERGGDAREPAADDGDTRASHAALRARLCASTQPFLPAAQRRPPPSTSSGWTAIRSSSRRYDPAIARTHAALRRSSSGTSVSPRSSQSQRPLRFEGDQQVGRPLDSPVDDVAAEAVEILCRQVDTADAHVLADVAQDVRELERDAEIVGEPLGGCAVRRLEDAERQAADRAGDASAVELGVGERRVGVPAASISAPSTRSPNASSGIG